jgi:hypothetical protein
MKALREEVWGDGGRRSTPNFHTHFPPGRSEEDRVRNEYEESQRTGDRDTQSSTVSGGDWDSPTERVRNSTISVGLIIALCWNYGVQGRKGLGVFFVCATG